MEVEIVNLYSALSTQFELGVGRLSQENPVPTINSSVGGIGPAREGPGMLQTMLGKPRRLRLR